MSLLLEALKKAERAKEEAQKRAREARASELTLDGASPANGGEAKPVVTRAELPDIKQPLEIASDEIAPSPPPSRAARPPGREAPSGQTRSEAQASARKVFEAKFAEPNPRLPFYIALGLLGVFAVGIVGYFWYELRPRAPLINATPKPPAPEQPVAALESKPAALSTVAAPAAIQGLPPTASGVSVPAAALPAPAAVPKPTALPRTPAPRVAPRTPGIEAAVARPQSPQIHPRVQSGYDAYLRGDFAAARAEYQEALRSDAGNRDALLGLAAVDMRTGRHEPAEATYLRLLQADPNDAHAHAGLIALRSARLDPVATESRVKGLLATDPNANVLHFTLANQLAQQGRWAEAQQHYFKAFAGDPENADFAYNLAVSLDHLRQTKLAHEYYLRALALAESRGASFDLAAVRSRAAQLGK